MGLRKIRTYLQRMLCQPPSAFIAFRRGRKPLSAFRREDPPARTTP